MFDDMVNLFNLGAFSDEEKNCSEPILHIRSK